MRGGGSSALRGVVLSPGIVNMRGGGFLCPEKSSIESRVCKLKGRGFQCPERSSIESRDCKFKGVGGGGSCVLRGVVLSRGIVNLRGRGVPVS